MNQGGKCQCARLESVEDSIGVVSCEERMNQAVEHDLLEW